MPGSPRKTRIEESLNINGVGSIRVKVPAKPEPSAMAMSEVSQIIVEMSAVSSGETLSL